MEQEYLHVFGHCHEAVSYGLRYKVSGEVVEERVCRAIFHGVHRLPKVLLEQVGKVHRTHQIASAPNYRLDESLRSGLAKRMYLERPGRHRLPEAIDTCRSML